METGYSIFEVMTKNVLRIEPDAKIIDCAKRMAENEIGSIVITNNGKVLGILTEQDMTRKVIANDLDPKSTVVTDVMSRDVHTITPEKDIYDAMVRMGHEKVKHLPVVVNEKLIGIISLKDIIRIEPDLIETLSFKSSLSDHHKKVIFNSPIL